MGPMSLAAEEVLRNASKELFRSTDYTDGFPPFYDNCRSLLDEVGTPQASQALPGGAGLR